MTEQELLEELSNIRFPLKEDGWIRKTNDTNPEYPSYNELRKEMTLAGISPSILWDKDMCINELKSKNMYEGKKEDITVDILSATVERNLNTQKNLCSRIEEDTSQLIDKLSSYIGEMNESILQKQMKMFK